MFDKGRDQIGEEVKKGQMIRDMVARMFGKVRYRSKGTGALIPPGIVILSGCDIW